MGKKRKAAQMMEKRKMDDQQLDEVRFQFGQRVTDLMSKIRSIPDDDAKVKQIFLWELLSNATRALVRLRLESMVDDDIHGPEPELSIHIFPDKENGSLTIIDTGIGMNNDELQSYLCDIPEDAYEEYLQNIVKYDTSCSDVDLSCLFSGGYEFLGFHSTYMVADKVVVTTMKTKGKQYVWQSNGCDSCTIACDTSGEKKLGRGTKVTLFLNKNHLKYLEERILNDLIKKYVEWLHYPVYIVVDEGDQKTKKEIVDDERQKVKQVPLETLKVKFEGLRQKVEKFLGSRVEKVEVSDRVFELANNLSTDRKTFEINPRSPIMEVLRQTVDDDVDDTELKKLIDDQFEACIYNIYAYDICYKTSYVERPDLDKAKCRFSSNDMIRSRV